MLARSNKAQLGCSLSLSRGTSGNARLARGTLRSKLREGRSGSKFPSTVSALPSFGLTAKDAHFADLMIFAPKQFEEVASDTIEALNDGRTVLLNLNFLATTAEQQRLLDFVTGGCYALGGTQTRVADGVVIFATRHSVKHFEPAVEELHDQAESASTGENTNLLNINSSDMSWSWEQ